MRGSLPGIVTLLVAISAAAAPGVHHRFEGPRALSLAERQDPFLLRKKLYPALKAAGIDRIEVVADGDSIVQTRSPSGMMYLDGLPLAALHGVALLLPARNAGAEIDLFVEGTGAPGDPDRMWTLRRDLTGSIVVLQGGPPLPLGGPDPTPDELSARFGIGELEEAGASWSADERRMLAKALELLSPRELDLLAGATFVRARRQSGGHAGLHTPSRVGEPSRIRLFDAAFAHDEGLIQYVGALDRAVPLPVFVILHQIGHAIANAERRRLLLERHERIESYERASTRSEQQSRFAAIESLDAELEELRTGLAPAERRYAALPLALQGPTEQGGRDAKEGFAEAFALHHVDPESLLWIAPEVHAWFSADGHLQSGELPGVAAPARPAPAEE